MNIDDLSKEEIERLAWEIIKEYEVKKGVPKLDVVWKKVSHFRNTGEVLATLPKLDVVWKKDK